MMSQQFLYKVWLPGQASTAGEPALTLHNAAALKFFVQAGSLQFPDTPFHVCAYYIANVLMERPVAEAVCQLHRSIGGRVEVYVVKEQGIQRDGRPLIASALKAACEEQEQVL